jgi:hypothetical protein
LQKLARLQWSNVGIIRSRRRASILLDRSLIVTRPKLQTAVLKWFVSEEYSFDIASFRHRGGSWPDQGSGRIGVFVLSRKHLSPGSGE